MSRLTKSKTWDLKTFATLRLRTKRLAQPPSFNKTTNKERASTFLTKSQPSSKNPAFSHNIKNRSTCSMFQLSLKRLTPTFSRVTPSHWSGLLMMMKKSQCRMQVVGQSTRPNLSSRVALKNLRWSLSMKTHGPLSKDTTSESSRTERMAPKSTSTWLSKRINNAPKRLTFL